MNSTTTTTTIKEDKRYTINVSGGSGNDNINININDKVKRRRVRPSRPVNKGFWFNIKWFFRELLKIYSSEPSFFSKKRIESSIAFIIAQAGMIIFFYYNYEVLDMSDFILWVSIEFAVSGYYVAQIQKQKKYDYYGNSNDYYNDDNFYGENNNDKDDNI